LEEKWPVENAFHLITACKTFSHDMQHNFKKIVGRKGKARRKFRGTTRRGEVNYDSY
jgi:hypothetical protein